PAPAPAGRSQAAAPPAGRPQAAPPVASRPQAAPPAQPSEYGRGSGRYATRARKRGPWRVVFWLALAVLVASLGALAYIGFTYWNGQRAYDEIASANLTVPEDAASATLADFSVDWDALRAVNPDVVGWVYVPGIGVNYPIVHRPHDDTYYLNHTFGGDTTGQFGAEFGCIMLSGENSGDFTDEVNVVYGHNMANGSMFAPFAGFTDPSVFNAHRTIYVLTPAGNYRLSTFAVDRIAGVDTTVVVPSQTPDELAAYVQKRMDDSLVAPDPAPRPASEISQVFAFSTCDNAQDTYRFVTFAEVVEYLPAGGTTTLGGSNAASGAAAQASGDAGAEGGADAVNPADVSSISDMAEERAS
ncbi:class B sortase, partial [Adlercreutzia sp. ZJ176]|uniref:class B sortase n=2 Tax=unclassified Adlercreutzia TaxID=2636013 RepID=UPI0013EC060D